MKRGIFRRRYEANAGGEGGPIDGLNEGTQERLGEISLLEQLDSAVDGGWGGIRTHETVARLPVFKTGAFNHSATHPSNIARHRRCRAGGLSGLVFDFHSAGEFGFR